MAWTGEDRINTADDQYFLLKIDDNFTLLINDTFSLVIEGTDYITNQDWNNETK